MKLMCDECGEIPCILFDGYSIRDRLLEGVMIKCYYKDGEWKVALQNPEDEAYTNDLNMKEIFKDALAFITDPDGLDIGYCPKCGADCDPPNLYHED